LGKRNRHLDFIGDGQHKILQVSKLVNEKDQFLQNGALVFAGYVQLDSFENEYCEYSNESQTLLKENLETKAPQMALLGKYFKDTNNEKEYEGDFSAFKIICDDGKEKRPFDVHRVIIAAGSPVFRAMLTNDCKESKDMSVIVSDISPGTMEKLLYFLYTGMIDAENVDTDLLSAANKYDIAKLKATCELRLIDGLEESTAIHFGVISEMYGSELFKNEVCKFIGQHWVRIKQNEDHLNIIKNYPDLMLRIMKYCN
jgi:speckle-type POZ protein